MSMPRPTWRVYAGGAIILWAVGLQVLILLLLCRRLQRSLRVLKAAFVCYLVCTLQAVFTTLRCAGEHVVPAEKA